MMIEQFRIKFPESEKSHNLQVLWGIEGQDQPEGVGLSFSVVGGFDIRQVDQTASWSCDSVRNLLKWILRQQMLTRCWEKVNISSGQKGVC